MPANLTSASNLIFSHHHGALHQETYDAIPCYLPHRDILLPAYIPETEIDVTPVAATSRPHKSLIAYNPLAATAQHAFHGVRVRREVAELWDRLGVEGTRPDGAIWEQTNIAETGKRMAQSLTCVTPPGVVRRASSLHD